MEKDGREETVKKRGIRLVGVFLFLAAVLTAAIRLSLADREKKPNIPEKSLGERLAEAEGRREKEAGGEEKEEGTIMLRWAFTNMEQEAAKPYEEALNAALREKGLPWRVSFTAMDGPMTNGMANPLSQKRRLEQEGFDIVSSMDYGSVPLYGMLAREGLLEPLDARLEETEAGRELREAYPECMWEAARVRGNLYGIPTVLETKTEYLIVNARLAEKYQVSLEELTPETFEKAFRIVTEGEWAEGNAAFRGGDLPIWEFGRQQTPVPFIQVSFADGKPKLENILEDEAYVREEKRRLDLLSEGYLFRGGMQEESALQKGNFFSMIEYGYDGEAAIRKFRKNRGVPEEIPLMAMELSGQDETCYVGSGKTGLWAAGGKKEEAFALLAAVYSDERLSSALSYGREGVDYYRKGGAVKTEAGDYWRLDYGGNGFLALPAEEDILNKKEKLWAVTEAEQAPAVLWYDLEPEEILGSWLALEELYREDWSELCSCRDEEDRKEKGGFERSGTCSCSQNWDEKLEKARRAAEEAGIGRVMEYMEGFLRTEEGQPEAARNAYSVT